MTSEAPDQDRVRLTRLIDAPRDQSFVRGLTPSSCGDGGDRARLPARRLRSTFVPAATTGS
jgi:hypothetical protein